MITFAAILRPLRGIFLSSSTKIYFLSSRTFTKKNGGFESRVLPSEKKTAEQGTRWQAIITDILVIHQKNLLGLIMSLNLDRN